MGVLNLLFASTSVGANRSYCGSSYTSIMVWLMYVLCTYMFGVCVCVCVMSLSHSRDVLESLSSMCTCSSFSTYQPHPYA